MRTRWAAFRSLPELPALRIPFLRPRLVRAPGADGSGSRAEPGAPFHSHSGEGNRGNGGGGAAALRGSGERGKCSFVPLFPRVQGARLKLFWSSSAISLPPRYEPSPLPFSIAGRILLIPLRRPRARLGPVCGVEVKTAEARGPLGSSLRPPCSSLTVRIGPSTQGAWDRSWSYKSSKLSPQSAARVPGAGPAPAART